MTAVQNSPGAPAKQDALVTATVAGLEVSVPGGSYFVVADARPLGATDAAAFCRELAATAGVVGIPLSAFSATPERYAGLVRFAFCKQPAVLRDAARRLATLAP